MIPQVSFAPLLLKSPDLEGRIVVGDLRETKEVLIDGQEASMGREHERNGVAGPHSLFLALVPAGP